MLDPASFAAWLTVGLACGWLAGKVSDAPSYGLLGEVFIGAIGGLIGGVGQSLLWAGKPAFWGSSLVALMGACAFIAVARALFPAAGPIPPTQGKSPRSG